LSDNLYQLGESDELMCLNQGSIEAYRSVPMTRLRVAIEADEEIKCHPVVASASLTKAEIPGELP
jgi:hypothetical protein